jgi:hypothetical protein
MTGAGVSDPWSGSERAGSAASCRSGRVGSVQ